MIKDLLKMETIFLDIEVPGQKKKSALKLLSEKCADYSGIEERTLFKAFEQREKIDSTGFGGGIAIPHAKLDKLEKPFIAIMRFKEPIDWKSIDGQPVKLVIALVMPKNDKNNTHLKVISSLSRKLANEEFIQEITAKENRGELYKFIIEKMEENAK
ncbi:PTS sugar transporter subunit IIA [Caproiciproducens galactitolivorans]|uniref:Nitrogen regulatory protein n=1 Tax=Caproiciproducens galactitolivorans TaxID=642589 RepID=A0A4Z0XYJ8_9FIRM|nr:fructose PTS transporter subunit IIA [Caproiciproducens galactitolivorans]TGJ75577.1 nitrogen regulatory protein [Caproiciproducens galactitolivorans]